MNRRILRSNGTEEALDRAYTVKELEALIRADGIDVVMLKGGMVMLVNDIGHKQNQPVNNAATFLYHGICRPGVEWQIRGDVAIVPDADFEIAYG